MNLEACPDRALELCLEAETELTNRVAGLGESELRAPSGLPDWTRAHVIAHLARNAEGIARRFRGALAGEDLAKYPGGSAQRRRDIEESSRQDAAALLADLRAQQAGLAELMVQSQRQSWPGGTFLGGGDHPLTACPARRLREVLMHLVDLDIGYTPAEWPADYVDWELRVLAATVPERLLDDDHRRSFLMWLSGRGPADPEWALAPWW